jgi:hypothetical protein
MASRDGRTVTAMRPGCTGGTEQREGHSGPEREREVWLTNGNSAARGRLGLNGVGGTGHGRRGVEAAAQRTRTGVGAAASDISLEASDKRCRRAAFTCGKQAMR